MSNAAQIEGLTSEALKSDVCRPEVRSLRSEARR
jgi:hypothetical protein